MGEARESSESSGTRPTKFEFVLNLQTARREFIRLLGGTAAVWPLARAQQAPAPVNPYASGDTAAKAPIDRERNSCSLIRSRGRDRIMRAQYASGAVFLFLCLVLIGEVAYYLPMLPDRLAIHFDASGRPNGGLSQAGFSIMVVVTMMVTAAIFASASLLGRIPDRLINLPNKSYWLAPERRDETLTFLREWSRWVLVLTLALLTLIFGLTLRANLATPPRLQPITIIWLAGAFIVILAALSVPLVWRFRASPE
jgi:Domain of unknown function (DUF1648)